MTPAARCGSLIRHSLDHMLRLTSSTNSSSSSSWSLSHFYCCHNIIIVVVIINLILICGWFSLLLSNSEKTEECGTWLSVLLFLPRRPYFKWKVLCFEGVMHYFETQPPPLTPNFNWRSKRLSGPLALLCLKINSTKELSIFLRKPNMKGYRWHQ